MKARACIAIPSFFDASASRCAQAAWVPVRRKTWLSVIAPLDDVLRRAGEAASRLPRHGDLR